MILFDLFLARYQWWRKWRGGVWYLEKDRGWELPNADKGWMGCVINEEDWR